jgi:hypothetical protein
VPIYHCSTKPLARSSGRSAVVAAAYRAGDRMVDERQGVEHDYSRCSDVVHTELVLPEGAGEWSRAELWNAAEKAEKRKDARTAREWEVALPDELGEAERRELAVWFARERRCMPRIGKATSATDRPPARHHAEGDRRPPGREMRNRAVRRQAAFSRSGAGADRSGSRWAEMWAEEVNQQLTQAWRPERVDHRSLAAQREEAIQQGQVEKAAELDRAPQAKLGWKVIQMVRRASPPIAAISSARCSLRMPSAGQWSSISASSEINLPDVRRKRLSGGGKASRGNFWRKSRAVFRGQGPIHREATLNRLRYLATREVPDVENARALWERDQWDPDGKAWRETLWPGLLRRSRNGIDPVSRSRRAPG